MTTYKPKLKVRYGKKALIPTTMSLKALGFNLGSQPWKSTQQEITQFKPKSIIRR